MRWCDELGAAFLEEVANSAESLADDLQLTGAERERVVGGARAALRKVLPGSVCGFAIAAGGSKEAAKEKCLLSVCSDFRTSSAGSASSGTGKSHAKDLWRSARVKAKFISTVVSRSHSTLADGRTISMSGEEAPLFPLVTNLSIPSESSQVEFRSHANIKSAISTCLVPQSPDRRPLQHSDTVGLPGGPSRRTVFQDSVKSGDTKQTAIDEGQTGEVFALEAGGAKIAVFKPSSGEQFRRRGFENGTGAVREEAAYIVDRLCDGRAGVPVTSRAEIEVDGKTVKGSVQQFHPDVKGFAEDWPMPRDLERAREFVSQEQADGLALLDMRIFNTDRHTANLLILRQDRPHGLGPIDHGCCLPPWWALSEANFEAWQDWPHFKHEPSQAARDLARKAHENLTHICGSLSSLQLPRSSIITLRLCTAFVKIGVHDLGMPIAELVALMSRNYDPELTWLETRVLACAKSAGASVTVQPNDRGDKELEVECEAALQEDVFISLIEDMFRSDLRTMVTRGQEERKVRY